MVFKPFNPLRIDRTPTSPTEEQKENANRLREYGWNQELTTEISFRVAKDIPEEIVGASKDGMYKAIEKIGHYGPMRVYYIGNNVDVIDEALLGMLESELPRILDREDLEQILRNESSNKFEHMHAHY